MNDKQQKGRMNIGVDLGTSSLLIYVEGRGTVFNEPSIIAVDKATKKVVAVGYEAAELVGKVHSKVEVVRPLQGGVISDVNMIREILIYTFEKMFVTSPEKINRLMMCVPSGITETEKQAMIQLGEELGVADTRIEEEIKAAAIGGGIDIYKPLGHLVIDIGGGTTDFGILSLGDLVFGRSTKVAGDEFDKQITNYVKEKHKLEIGPQTAEKIKIHLASLTGDFPEDEEGNVVTYNAMGRDLVTGLPRMVVIEAHEVRDILLHSFEAIKSTLIATLEATPPELSGDLVDTGILVTGGGALIKGVKEYIEDITNVNVRVCSSPITAVIDGTKRLLKINNQRYYGDY